MDDSRIKGYLGTSNLVGVRIDKDNGPPDDRRPPKKKRFCQIVKEATEGSSCIFNVDDLDCPNAMIALGFQEPSFIEIETRITPADTKSVEVAPLKEIESPDVVLIILNPMQLMMIGNRMGIIEAKFKGDMAVCGEATASVYMNKKPNMSPLCGGARKYAKYKDSELIFGAPLQYFKDLDEKIATMPVKDKVASKLKKFKIFGS